jgi:LPS-assembly lipoprotein
VISLSHSGLLTAGVAVLSLLTACGFHLRGGVELPPVLEDAYVDSKDRYGSLSNELRLELQAAGAQVVDDRKDATGILKLTSPRSQQRVLSVGSAGRATEYELFEEVTFALEKPDGEVLLAPQTVRMTRDMVFDDTQLLGKVSEAEVLRRQMHRDMARQILTRIEVAMRGR